MAAWILALLLLSGGASAYAEEYCALPPCDRIAATSFLARVIVVMDGDTVMVLHGNHPERVRLAGIDAPEVDHAGMGGQPPNSQKQQDFGVESRQSLAEMVLRKQVWVTALAVDKYGRTVALLARGKLNVNEEQLRRGMAWAAAEWWRSRRAESRPPEGQASEEITRLSTGLADSANQVAGHDGVPWAGESRLHRDQRYIALQDGARQARRGLWSQPDPMPPWQWRKVHADAAAAPSVLEKQNFK